LRLLIILFSAFREYTADDLAGLRLVGVNRASRLCRFFLGLAFFSSGAGVCICIVLLGDFLRENNSGVASLSASMFGVAGDSPPIGDESMMGFALLVFLNKGVLGTLGRGLSGDLERGISKKVVWPAGARRLGNSAGAMTSLAGP